jgi:predicted extracellular nuclease
MPMNRFARRLALATVLCCAALSAQAQVAISQVYGAGGNSGASYNRDFVELFNRGSTPVSLTGTSLQYASATGTGNFGANAGQLVALPDATLQPGQYFLVGLGGGSNGAPLPSTDAEGTINMSGSAGKMVLVEGTSGLGCNGGSTPCTPEQEARILDLVGYGGANYFEGSGPAPALTSTTAALRADDGCGDSDDNATDFSAAAPAPRNSAAAIAPCGSGGTPVLNIGDASTSEGGDGATTEFLFTLSLSAPAGAGGVTVAYATVDGTGLAGSDYAAESGTVTIPEGATSVTIGIVVAGDGDTEPDETFHVDLSDVGGATLGKARGIGTILNDDIATVAIHAIQGTTDHSPLAGQQVATRGIVTGRKSNGFFLQTPDAAADADAATSEGVFVYTGGTPPTTAQIGNEVIVQGTVVEFLPPADPGQLNLTEITSPIVTFVGAGNPLPEPVQLTPDFPSPTGPLDQLERVESMRVTAQSFTVIAATDGNVNEASATSSSNGQLNLVVTGTPRPFREPGIQAPDPAPGGGSIPPIPRWDFNPEVLFSDTDALGGPRHDLAVGATLSNYVGPLDYGFRRYSVHQDPTVAPTIAQGPAPAPARAPTADEFTFAIYNLERFFDTTDDPAVDERVLTAEAFAMRLEKASLGIRDFLHAPDIVGVVEMENLATLQALAAKINADAVAAGQPDPNYAAYLEEGNDVGGIDVGFLVKTGEVRAGVARVQVQDVVQLGKDETWTEPDGSTSLLNDRPPLLLDATVQFADGRSLPITAVVVHQRSLIGAEEDTAAGARVRAKRQRQADYLAQQLQAMQAANPERHLVIGGDFNAFEFNDGLTDAMGTVTGLPSPDETTAVTGDGIDLVDPDLFNLYVLEPEGQRYSFEFDGNAQSLDHILINQALGAHVGALALDHARINADFPEINRNDLASASRLSDHDPAIAYFSLASADLALAADATPDTAAPGATIAFDVRLSNAGPHAATWPGVGFAFDAALPDLAVDAPEGWSCDAPTVENGGTVVACAAPTLAKNSVAEFRLTATAPQAAAGRTIAMAASVEAQSFDPEPGNDHAGTSVAIALPTDLSLSISGPKQLSAYVPVAPYVYHLRNDGTQAALAPRVILRGNTGTASPLAPPGWRCEAQADEDPRTFAFVCSSTRALAAGRTVLIPLLASTRPLPQDRILRVEGSITSDTPEADPPDNKAASSTRLR